MGKLLTILGISQEVQHRLPNDVLEGEQFLNVLQAVYEQSPESKKKDALAQAIAENVRLLLEEVAKVKIETVQEEPQKVEPTPIPAEEPIPDEPTPSSEPTPTNPSKPKAPKKPKIDKEKERVKKELQEQIDEIQETLSLFAEEEEEYQELLNELNIISEQINQLNN